MDCLCLTVHAITQLEPVFTASKDAALAVHADAGMETPDDLLKLLLVLQPCSNAMERVLPVALSLSFEKWSREIL